VNVSRAGSKDGPFVSSSSSLSTSTSTSNSRTLFSLLACFCFNFSPRLTLNLANNAPRQTDTNTSPSLSCQCAKRSLSKCSLADIWPIWPLLFCLPTACLLVCFSACFSHCFPSHSDNLNEQFESTNLKDNGQLLWPFVSRLSANDAVSLSPEMAHRHTHTWTH